jgi:hypothetical protein
MLEVEYLTDKLGQPKAVVIPIEVWRQLFPSNGDSVAVESLTEGIEDYCLNKAMDEAQESPLLNRQEALAYLEEEE